MTIFSLYARTELNKNVSALERNDGADEGVLELCLKRTLNQEGKVILRNLAKDEGVRTDIRARA